MSVFGGILLFVSGVAIGGGAVAYNYHSIRRAINGLRKENEHLKNSAWEDRLEYVHKRAYEEGYAKGRKSPLSDVERFADTMEGNGIGFRMTREPSRSAVNGGAPNGQAAKR